MVKMSSSILITSKVVVTVDCPSTFLDLKVSGERIQTAHIHIHSWHRPYISSTAEKV